MLWHAGTVTMSEAPDKTELDVKIEELKEIKDRRPFQPFLIRMADGTEIQVSYPDTIAWALDNPVRAICICYREGTGSTSKSLRSLPLAVPA